jgi:hypothetical protein
MKALKFLTPMIMAGAAAASMFAAPIAVAENFAIAASNQTAVASAPFMQDPPPPPPAPNQAGGGCTANGTCGNGGPQGGGGCTADGRCGHGGPGGGGGCVPGVGCFEYGS